MGYLIKLAQHSLSCLFGTFLCNTLRERIENSVFERTFSVWPFLSGSMYRNPLYVPNREKVLWPAHNVRDLSLWTEVYLGSLGNQNSIEIPSCNVDGLHGSMSPMAKTRSYGDLITAGIIQNGISRRSSDPNMTVDPNLTIGSSSENNSIADIQSERGDSPDIIANMIHDTTRKLQNLTTELNNHDDENFVKSFIPQQQQNASDNNNEFYNTNQDADDDEEDSASNYEKTMQEIFKQKQRLQANASSADCDANSEDAEVEAIAAPPTANGSSSSLSSTLFSNPPPLTQSEQRQLQIQQQLNNLFEIGCESKAVAASSSSTDSSVAPTPPPLPPLDSLSLLNDEMSATAATVAAVADLQQSSFKGFFLNTHALNCTGVDAANGKEKDTDDKPKDIGSHYHHNGDYDGNSSGGNVEKLNGGITIHKAQDMHLNLMQSVDLGDPGYNALLSSSNGFGTSTDESQEKQQQNMWHGSINTSTDTLVPTNGDNNHTTPLETLDNMFNDVTDSSTEDERQTTHELQTKEAAHNAPLNSSTNCSILPKVHSSNNSNGRLHAFVASASINASEPNRIGSNNNSESSYCKAASFAAVVKSSPALPQRPAPPPPINFSSAPVSASFSPAPPSGSPIQSVVVNPMEESILILPEHQKLEISFSGKCESVANNIATATETTSEQQPISNNAATPSFASASATAVYSSYAPFANAFVNNSAFSASNSALFGQTRRQRTLSSNSRRNDCPTTTRANGSTTSRYSIPGVRSLPMTPPGLTERSPQIAISCPDGLTHALSEQNIRLQQIVHEHKLREDVLLREIHDMRMALLKKICPNCNNAPTTNDEQCSALDNVENASVCSWEAVEDRSGPPSSSCTSSSIQPNAASVLWVPDHAVSRCTSCQTEFWLGRRKHHCRSCGQIFCADCSEFWAPLPDVKLFSPVRLCGPCYHSVTTRMQQVSQFQNGAALLQLHQQQQQNVAAMKAAAAAANTMTAPSPAVATVVATPAAATSKA